MEVIDNSGPTTKKTYTELFNIPVGGLFMDGYRTVYMRVKTYDGYRPSILNMATGDIRRGVSTCDLVYPLEGTLTLDDKGDHSENS